MRSLKSHKLYLILLLLKFTLIGNIFNCLHFYIDHVFGQKAEGQRAQLAYEKALRDGFVNVYRGRILLIGQDRAGKTSLKKSLLGLPFDPKEQSTDGIEVEASTCEIEVEQVKNWHSTRENKPGLVISSKEISRIVAEKLCEEDSEENFEDEFEEVNSIKQQV